MLRWMRMSLLPFLLDTILVSNSKKTKGKQKILRLRSLKMRMIGSPLYVVGRFFLLSSHWLVNLIRLVNLLLNLSLSAFQTQDNLLREPLMLLLRLTVR
ncbi:hypothetical protein Goshw_001614 [Gossypium schwendimanii]|uniref:Uncharacterized protein n=1 Tax=Gossypium schwendimanii TaxID=34291 RepID=A0A7J9ND80_GOSSC|nr:hypothetical protein [Gossypium schwendimanii]